MSGTRRGPWSDVAGRTDDTAGGPGSRVAQRFSRWRQPRGSRNDSALSYRYLARQVDVDLPVGERGQAILFSSPAPLAFSNEASLMFAHSLAAELGRRVLLVDGTFGDHGVGAALGHAGEPGFVDLVYGATTPLGHMARPSPRENVFVLPAGRTDVAHLLPIEAATIAGFFAAACAQYDYVLLQQGAIFAEPRYLQFTRRADMVLMLVEEGDTPVDALSRCMAVFRDHQIRNVRLVLSVPR